MTNCQSDTKKSESTTTTATSEKTNTLNSLNLLQGRWGNVSSDKEFIIFTSKNLIRRFAGATPQEDNISNILYDFYENCHAPCQTQSTDPDVSKFKCFTVKENGEFVCYKILKLDETDLHFMRTDETIPMFAYKRLQ